MIYKKCVLDEVQENRSVIYISSKRNVDYKKQLNPIYIEAVEANHIYINSQVIKNNPIQPAQYKIKNEYVNFKEIGSRKAVLYDSLFLRYMRKKITVNTGNVCRDFIVLKFNYDAEYKIGGMEYKVDKHDLRYLYYKDGFDYVYEKKDKQGNVIEKKKVHYKMLMRSTGKAKDGECVFIRDSLHSKAINFLTMGLYDLMDKQSQQDPDKVFRLVELSAYQTLTTATAKGYIQIPLENILIVKDEEVYSDEMKACLVRTEDVEHIKEERVPDFDNPRFEELINKKGFTFDEHKAKKHKLTFVGKTREDLKNNGIRTNGKYPYITVTETQTNKECKVDRVSDANIKNILWDGMGLIDESIFPKDKEGFIYCRSHFFKSCLFRGNIQKFFEDYCNDNNVDYDTYTLEDVDMFERKIKLSDIKVIITDKSLKWTKFVDMMGGTDKKAYRYYRRYMKIFDDYFSIVKTAHSSKLGDLQLMAYQMNNSLPTTDVKVLENVSKQAIDIINELKLNDEAYLKYLEQTKDAFNINEVILALIDWNPDFVKTEFFRKKKSADISKLTDSFCQGRLPQVGDNLTIMDNPIGLLLNAVGENPLNEGCFDFMEDAVQCYTPRFTSGEKLAAFRSPHNSPNNIIHLHNVYPERLIRYFPNVGQNVIVFNAIKTDTQARLSGHDCDTDFVYVTNQKDLADLARKAYVEYPTIINLVEEKGSSDYHFTPEDYARMDNQIADNQEAIGTSTDTAQLALSYYYDEGMASKDLEDNFIILSVLGQIAIDLAKKDFDIEVTKEINRIRNLPCIKNKDIPQFFADTKKSRNNKVYKESKKRSIRSMNCPMDIIAKIIDKNIIGYAPRISHLPMRNFWNKNVEGKVNRYKKELLISASEKFNESNKWLELHKKDFTDDTFFELKNRNMNRFLNKAKKKLDTETIMQLVIYATHDDNTDVRNAILNYLFINCKDEFLECFVRNRQKTT